MAPKLYWIETPLSGRLAISARPRGRDWLEDDVREWRRAGVDAVVSLLTAEEERDFQLSQEGSFSAQQGMKYLAFPIPDRGVPESQSAFEVLLSDLRGLLNKGQNVAVHCRQGIGRSGMLAAALIAENGVDPKKAIEKASSARGLQIPETNEQIQWVLGTRTAVFSTPRK